MKKPLMNESERDSMWVKLHGRALKKFLSAQAKRSHKEYLREAVQAKTKAL